MVHIPNHGAHTQQAHYKIYLGGTLVGQRSIPTRIEMNEWVNLGVFDFTSTSAVPTVVLSNQTDDGQATDDVAWDAAAFTPLPAKPKHFIVAMGDSYTSGEGAGSYASQSDNNLGNLGWDACRRSANSWIRKTIIPGGTTPLGNLAGSFDQSVDLATIACSGATTTTMTTPVPSFWTDPFSATYYGYNGGAEGRFREADQLDAGFLDANTTLVALTIGGNDAGFADTIRVCIIAGCEGAAYEKSVMAGIDAVQSSISGVITAIHDPSRAKNAKIVLMGYPKLFGAYGSCVMITTYPGLTVTEQAMLNRAATHMRDVELSLVKSLQAQKVPVTLADAVDMLGQHTACGGQDEWINKVVLGPNGRGDFPTIDIKNSNPSCQWQTICISRESVHPKDSGTTAYANLLQNQLSVIGYRW
jgi:hypothetical protein